MAGSAIDGRVVSAAPRMAATRCSAWWAMLIIAACGENSADQGGPARAALDGSGSQVSHDRTPTNLRVNHAAAPLGIESSPRFAWDSGIARQTAYRVAVFEQGNLGDALWDSGKVASSNDLDVPYAGPPLRSASRYDWRVRVWDASGHASDWSEAGRFETGLLQEADWGAAEWIGGRVPQDHDWTDMRLTSHFRIADASTGITFLFHAQPVGKTWSEAHAWTLRTEGESVQLIAATWHYAGNTGVPGGSPEVEPGVNYYNPQSERNPTAVGVRSVAIATIDDLSARTAGDVTAENIAATDHEIAIEVAGTAIATRIDGHEVDRRTLTEPDQLRASGTIGFAAGSSGTIRDVAVESPDRPAFSTSFANHSNPFEAGIPIGTGRPDAGGVQLVDKNVMLPIANAAPLVRTSFRTRGSPIESARLFVAAGGYPVVTVNGNLVTTDGKRALRADSANIPHLLPDHTNHDRTVLYNTFDVTEFLSPGCDNVIAAELGRGWYGVTVPGEWYWNMASYHGSPRIRARLVISYGRGETQIVATAPETWRTADGPTTFDSVYTGEKYDARIAAALGDWQRPGYDDSAWSPATAMNPPGSCPQGGCVGFLPDTGPLPAAFAPARLRAQENEPVHVYEVLHPVGIVETFPGSRVYIFEMGNDRSQLVAGWARLTLAGVTPDKAGLTIRFRQDESRSGAGTVDSPYMVSEANRFTDGNFQTDYYTLSGARTQSWAAKFRYGGVRFIEVRGLYDVLGREPDLVQDRDLLSVEAVRSGGEPAGTFSSNNALLERIMRNSSYAQWNNNVHKPNDTPSREKNGWTGDGWADSEANIQNNDVVRFFVKWGRDFPDSVISTGEWSEIVPAVKGGYGYDGTPGWSFLFGPTPAWDAAFFFIPWELYQYAGETDLLRELYPAQKRFMSYYASRFEPPDYLFSNAGSPILGDYQSQGPSGRIEVINMQLYYYFADYMAKVGELIGEANDAAAYRALADGVLTSFIGRYWDARSHWFVDGGPATQNVMAIAFGMVPGSDMSGPLFVPGPTQAENMQTVASRVAGAVADASNHLQGGIYGLRSLFNVLADHGHVDLSYSMVTQVTAPSWGDLIGRGNTALTESWNADTGNHHYFSSVMTWYYQDVLGIRPTSPGYRTVRIKPAIPLVAGTSSVPPFTDENPEVTSTLDRASGTLRTVRGVIGSAWTREADGRIRLGVTIPSNTPAEVWVPTSGQPVEAPAGAELVRLDGTGSTEYAVFTVGPGSHVFNP